MSGGPLEAFKSRLRLTFLPRIKFMPQPNYIIRGLERDKTVSINPNNMDIADRCFYFLKKIQDFQKDPHLI